MSRKKDVGNDVMYSDWLMLVSFFEIKLDEGEITKQTHDRMINYLMTLKPDFEKKVDH